MNQVSSSPTYCELCMRHPWQISCTETVLELAPGVGALGVGCMLWELNRQIKEYVKQNPPGPLDHVEEGPAVSGSYSTAASLLPLQPLEQMQVKKSNYVVLITLNLAICLIALGIFGALGANRVI